MNARRSDSNYVVGLTTPQNLAQLPKPTRCTVVGLLQTCGCWFPTEKGIEGGEKNKRRA